MRVRHRWHRLLLCTLLGVMAAGGLWLTLGVRPVHAVAGINEQINFQGRLYTSAGATVPDGYYNIQFKIYQDGDGQSVGNTTGSPAGTLKWTENHLNANSQGVQLKNGFMSVQLGSVTAFGSSIDWDQTTLWLSMNIASTNGSCTPFANCSPDGEMIPMKRLSSTPYALNAGRLGGLSSAGFIQNTTTPQSANVAVQSASSTAIAALIQGAASQSADIFQVKASGVSTPLVAVGSSGAVKLQNSANSTAAFQVQNAAGTSNLIVADTQNTRVGIGKATPSYTLDVNGDINVSTGSSYRVNGIAGTSAACSGNSSLQGTITAGGITTSGTCKSQDLQNAYNNGGQMPAVLQDVTATSTTSSVTTTPSATGNTNLLVAIVSMNAGSSQSVTSITDNAGNTWTLAGAGFQAGSNSRVEMWYAKNATSTTSVTANISASIGTTMNLLELSNMDLTSPLDAVTTQGNASGTTAPTGTVNTANATDVVIATSSFNAVGVTASSLSSPWTNLNTVTNGDKKAYSAYRIVGSTGGYNATWSLSGGSAASGTVIAAFKTTGSSSAAATVNLTTGKDLVITSPDVATDPSVVVNLQCTTCSASGGRFAIQSSGTDVFRVAPNGGAILAKNLADSTTAFQIQPAGSTTSVFNVDTSNSRVGIGMNNPGYALDVVGDINTSTQYRIAGTVICTSSGCTPAAGSGNYIQNTTTLQTANIAVQSAATGSVAALIQGAASQTADVLQVKANGVSTALLAVSAAGKVTLKNSTDGADAFTVLDTSNNTLLSVNTSTKLLRVVNTTPTNITLASGSGAQQIGTDTSTNLAFDDNDIQARNNGAAGTLSLQRLGGGLNINADTVTVKPTSNSTTAFQVQPAASTTPVFNVDTSNARIGVGTAAPAYPLDVVGDINTSTQYRIAGVAGATVGCGSGAGLTSSTFRGGIVTGGTCLQQNLQNAYNNSNPTPVKVQEVTNTAAAATSISATPAATANGNMLVAIVSLYTGSSQSVTSMTDSAGNTWALAGAGFQSGSISRVEIWYAKNAASTTSVTANLSTTLASTINLIEFSNIDPSLTLDVAASQGNASGTSAPTATLTTTNASDLLIAAISYDSSGITTTGPGGSWTSLTDNVVAGSKKVRSAYQTVSSIGGYSATWTLSGGSAASGAVIAAFRTTGGLTLSTGRDLTITAPDVATDPSVVVNLLCTTCSASGGRFAIQNAGVDVFKVNPNGGSILGKNTTDSTTAFQIQPASSSTPVLNVDTQNSRVGIGTAAPGFNLEVNASAANAVIAIRSTGGSGRVFSLQSTTSGTLAVRDSTAGTDLATFSGSGLYLGNGVTATAPSAFSIQGTGSSTTAVAGGALTIQGGNATVGNANGGNVTVTGGTGFGTGVNGLVVLATPTFSTTANDANCYTGGALVASDCTMAASSVNNSAAIIVGFSVNGKIATMPDPTLSTAGRVVYVTAANGSSDFTLSVNGGGTGNTIAMRQNTTATMIWNGADWTAAGASSSTTLQSAYDNTLQSAGGAELIVSKTSNTNGLTIRDSTANPVNGTLLSVQTSSAAGLFQVNSNVTEYASNAGAETAGGTSTTFPANTWSAVGSSTVSRYITAGNFIATGQASVSTLTTTAANDGVKNQLTTSLTAGTTYNVSFAARLSSGTFTDMNVYYSNNGTAASVACTTTQIVPTSVWTKVNCTFTAPSSGITSSNAILIRQTGSGTARTFYAENLSVTIAADYNYATDGGVDDNTNFATNWSAVASSTVTRSTTVGNDASSSAQVVTTGSNQGVRNKLAISPLTSTLYRVTVYAASTTSGFNSFQVRYSRDGGTNFIDCADYNTQAISSSITSFTKVTCYITTDSTAPSDPYVYFRQTDATGRTFYVDTFSMNLSSVTTPNVQVGGGVNGGPTTLFTVDRGASAPIASNNDALLGSMYYDTTLGKLQCYEADGWGACGSSPDNIITISPEYTNAVLHGTGVGNMTSDLCSDGLNINDGSSSQPTICGTNETYNFYKWTSPQASAQTYSIYVTYQLPATFKSFSSGQTSLMGRTDSSNATVQYQIYRNNASGLTACGSTITVSTGSVSSWQTGTATGAADPSTCGFGGGNSIVFKINVIASSNANAYVGNLNFTFSNR